MSSWKQRRAFSATLKEPSETAALWAALRESDSAASRVESRRASKLHGIDIIALNNTLYSSIWLPRARHSSKPTPSQPDVASEREWTLHAGELHKCSEDRARSEMCVWNS